MITLMCMTLEDFVERVKRNLEVLSYEEIRRVYFYGFLSELSPEYPVVSYNAMFMRGAISLEQPLSLSHPIRALSMLELRKAKEHETEDLKNLFVLSAVESYLNVAVLREKKRILNEILENLESIRKISEYHYRIGNLKFSEIKFVDVKIRTVKAEMERILGELKREEEMLRFYYGEDLEDISLPKAETLPSLDSLMGFLETSPSLKYREFTKRSKRYEMLSKIFPLTISPGILYHKGELSFSISLEIPLWIWRYWWDISSSRAEYRMEEYRYTAEKERRKFQLRGLYLDYLRSLEVLNDLERSLEEIEKVLEVERENYKVGKSEFYELLKIYNEALDLRMKVIEYRAEVLKKVYRLKGLIGLLLST